MTTFDSFPSMTRRKLLGLAALIVLAPASALAAGKTLRGSVSYRERIALPPHALLEVRLLDVSLADARAKSLAVIRVKTRHRLPIPYRLHFDDSQIRPGRSYALSARITVDGRLWFITTTRHAVFAGGPDETDIRVERVKSASTEAGGDPSGRWRAQKIRNRGVIGDPQTVIEIARDGRVTGSGGCNRISGKAAITGSRISFGPMISTRMACAPAIMDQENKFLAALGDVRSWQMDERKLILLDARKAPVVLLARM